MKNAYQYTSLLERDTRIMKTSEKIIIGLVGEPGSGKDTVADYLKEKHGAYLYRFADPLQEALELYLDKISREDLQWLALQFKKKFGKDILSRGLRKKIELNGKKIIVINGIRFPEDFNFVKSLPNSYVLYVTLDSRKRWRRVSGRGQKTDDKASYERFLELEQAETEVRIPEIGKKADFRLENSETKEDLFAKVDEILKSITK